MFDKFVSYLNQNDDSSTVIGKHDLYDHLLLEGAEAIVPERYKELGFIPPTLLGEVYANVVAQIREMVLYGQADEFNEWVQTPLLFFQMSQVVFGVPTEETALMCREEDILEAKTYTPDEEYLFGWYLDLWDFWSEYHKTNADMPGQV